MKMNKAFYITILVTGILAPTGANAAGAIVHMRTQRCHCERSKGDCGNLNTFDF